MSLCAEPPSPSIKTTMLVLIWKLHRKFMEYKFKRLWLSFYLPDCKLCQNRSKSYIGKARRRERFNVRITKDEFWSSRD